jgi:hypothetical protein
MREIQAIFPSDGNVDEMNAILHKSLGALIKLPKKTSRALSLSIRDVSGLPVSHTPYVYHLLRRWEKKLPLITGLKGISLLELDSFLELNNALDVKLQAQLMVNPEIRDYILGDDSLKRNVKRSEKALIAKILTRSKRGLDLTQVKLRNALGNMVRAGLLRSTFEDNTRYYKLPDKTLYGDPKNSKGDPVL